jgi:hypothetical protein
MERHYKLPNKTMTEDTTRSKRLAYPPVKKRPWKGLGGTGKHKPEIQAESIWVSGVIHPEIQL